MKYNKAQTFTARDQRKQKSGQLTKAQVKYHLHLGVTWSVTLPEVAMSNIQAQRSIWSVLVSTQVTRVEICQI
jgi:hypothetical protein